MDLQVGEVQKGTRISAQDMTHYYKDEITRVETAIEDATKRMVDLRGAKILTGDKAKKIAELNYAIAVGKIYLRRLKNKI